MTFRLTLIALLMGLCTTLAAQDTFDQSASCEQSNGFTNTDAQAYMESFSLSFLISATKRNIPFTPENQQLVMEEVIKLCAKMPGATYRQVTAELANLVAPARVSLRTTARSPLEEEARAVIETFMIPFANTYALTQQLIPTKAEINAIFVPELAVKVGPYIDDIFGGGERIQPGRTQKELISTLATTSDINWQTRVMREFPGGYKRLAGLMKPGIPVLRFKFVEPGATSGLAFDGLYKVGDRWVIIPKAWRLVDQ